MKVIKMEQNTEDWLEFRKGKSGGSEFKDLYVSKFPTKAAIIAKLEEGGQPLPPADKRATVAELAGMLEPEELVMLKLDADPKKRYWEMIAERVARPITPNDYAERLDGVPFSMMARGHLLEPEAADCFAKRYKKKLAGDVVWQSDNDPNIYISPDRYVVKKGEETPTEAVEIKCLGNAETVKTYLTGHYPVEYEPQVWKYFMVNDQLQTLYFVVYTDTIPGLELQVFKITRKEVEPYICEATAFENAILKMVERDADKIIKLSF